MAKLYQAERSCFPHENYCEEAQKEIKRRLAMKIVANMDFEDLEKVFEIEDQEDQQRTIVKLKVEKL
jgi:hypothetical protein